MNWILILKAAILGVVEGITEFLPISSTGHMILVGSFINFTGTFAQLFEVFIQFGAIISVIVLYRKKIWKSLKNLKRGEFGYRLWIGVIAAFIPSAIIGLAFNNLVDKYLWNVKSVSLALIVGGIAMIVTENIFRNKGTTKRSEDVTPKQGFVIGLFQSLSAIWPGFSRSASTIMGGWVMGMTTAAAAEFTFFLAIPTMFAASGASLLKSAVETGVSLTGSEIVALIVGFVIAFFVALFVVQKFINYLKTKPLRVFAYYRIIVGILMILLAVTGLVKFNMMK
jgi:undecaprenyl-diphosphatase